MIFQKKIINLHTKKYRSAMTLKDQIINKAFFQFLNKGYKVCSLKDLEQATDLTKGAFYYYFKNKEEILKIGIERYLSVIKEMDESEFLKINTLKEYINIVIEEQERNAAILSKLFDYFILEVSFFQLILEVTPLFPEFREKINVWSRNRLTRWEFMILKAKQQEEIKENLDTSILARNLMSVATSMLNIELQSEDLRFTFSDLRLQFEQYYLLIKR